MSDESGEKLSRRRARGTVVALAGIGGILAVAAHTAAAQGSARGGEQVVKAICISCHETGKGGAPRIGDRDAWVPRLKLGVDNLVSAAIRGHDGMPPRGGQANLTDAEIRSAILYMFNPAAGKEPAAAKAKEAAPVVRPWSNYVKTAGGMEIHLGFVSAESLRRYPKGSPESTMHGGVPSDAGYYHVNVSLIDHASKAPVRGARVEAKVEQVGLSSKTMLLEPITFDNVPSYGNYFKLSGRTSYRITVKIQKAGSKQVTQSQFEHRVN
jgi:cytochrome c5